MAIQVKRRWEPAFGQGLPRKDRRGCDYEAYIPDALVGRRFWLEGEVVADIADAEAAVQRLNIQSDALSSSEALARLLLRADAVASSRIEGLEVGPRRLLRAEAARQLGDEPADVMAEEVLGNVAAMAWAVQALTAKREIAVEDVLEMHRLLLSGTRLMNHGGTLRDSQNWIGGSDYNPCNAAFVPPPADEVRPLLEDLCAFCNSDDLPAVAQAAIAHAQFETIHPFTDGNGRTGRALIHVILRRRRLAPRVLPPVSLVLATWSRDYIDSLMATRYVGSPDAPEAIAGLNRWIGLFAAACRRAVDDARIYEETVAGLKARWLERLGRPRRRSAAALLLDILPAYPILSVGSAARVMGRSFQATNQAIGRLLEAHILRPIKVSRRNRAFEAAELIDAFNVLERRLASPTGDTRISPPARRAPARRR